MKKLALLFIIFYQKILSPLFKNIFGINKMCRFPISCSEYAKRAIIDYGLIKGFLKSISRLLSCQPFFKVNLWRD